MSLQLRSFSDYLGDLSVEQGRPRRFWEKAETMKSRPGQSHSSNSQKDIDGKQTKFEHKSSLLTTNNLGGQFDSFLTDASGSAEKDNDRRRKKSRNGKEIFTVIERFIYRINAMVNYQRYIWRIAYQITKQQRRSTSPSKENA